MMRRFTRFAVHAALITAGAGLLALSFPSDFSFYGWFPLAFISLVPLFVAANRLGWWSSFLWGGYFGYIAYVFYANWLLNFHPLSIFIIPSIFAFFFFFTMPAIRLMRHVFPRFGFLFQPFFWVAYEYLHTKGFTGFSYGIVGYTQYLFGPLVRLSSLTGVWGVSLLVVFPSVLLAWIINDFLDNKADTKQDSKPFWHFFLQRRYGISAAVYLLVFISALLYGQSQIIDLEDVPVVKAALVQQNIDPWVGGAPAYEKSLEILMEQSSLALEEHPETEIVVWSETSFVPSVGFHTRTRINPESYRLVDRLMEFLAVQKVPYVIGNSDRRLRRNESGQLETYDYNAVLLVENGEIQETYRKMHLVPFTEHFPYKRQFPWLYQILVEANTTFWAKGNEYTVFDSAGMRFSTPVCFEDTFGYLNRGFVQEGAEVLVNLTNDSWAHSVTAAMQHMAMAVFRAAENQRSVVRSSNGGMTCVIDPNGKIIDMMEPFEEGYLPVDIPVYTAGHTGYTRWGNWFGIACVGIAAILLLAVAFRCILRLTEDRQQGQNRSEGQILS